MLRHRQTQTKLHSVFLRFQQLTTQDTEQHEFIYSFSLQGRYESRQKGIGAELAISLRSPRRILAERQKNIRVKLENKSIEALRESLRNPPLQCMINVYL